ncbi:MAG: ComF family protein [Ignavibacteriales bacterium]|nr:ComF family protein [Ignavibacteriales bacterium]
MNILFRYIIKPVREFIYPPVCFICNNRIEDESLRVCSLCWGSFKLVEPSDPTWKEIKAKFDEAKFIDDIISCYLFEKDGKLQDLIHQLKYQGIKSHGIKLGEMIGVKILLDNLFSNADFLIPVPLHKLKKRERGYNQAELICNGISNKTKIPVENTILERIKYTQTQTTLSLIERKENMQEAFILSHSRGDKVKGKRIILVDDVITTGATINSCAKTLLQHNAKSILAASIALAQ